MNIGVSTSCFYPMLTEQALKTVGEAGVPCTEIFFNALSELSEDFVRELLKIREEYGINVVSIHPTMSLAESFMLFSAYDRRLQEGLDQYRRYSEIAAAFGAKYLIMHGGKPNKVLNDLEYCERFAQIARVVRENGAVLLQENVAKYRAGELRVLELMAKELGDEANFCLDVKQCVRNGYTAFDMMERVGDHVRHIHLSDHDLSNDCLLPPRGSFDFNGFYDLLKQKDYRGDAVIEVYRDAYGQTDEVFRSCEILNEKKALAKHSEIC